MDTQSRDRASRLRQEVVQLQAEVNRRLEAILRTRAILRGSLYQWKRRCGAQKCRCQKGELHSNWVFSYRKDGKLRKVAIPSEELSRYEAAVGSYRAFRAERVGVVKAQARVNRLLRDLETEMRIEAPRSKERQKRQEELP